MAHMTLEDASSYQPSTMPLEMFQVPADGDHKALNGGTLGGCRFRVFNIGL